MKIFACCDSKYYLEHGKAFSISCKKVGHTSLVKILNPTNEAIELSKELGQEIILESNVPENKAIFASKRFIDAPSILQKTKESLLILDIDSFFNTKVSEPDQDVGIFLREYEQFYGMKVAAGIVYYKFTNNGLYFAKEVSNCIVNSQLVWYVDQISIYKIYKKLSGAMPIFIFDNYHLDWNFNDDSLIWSGKGDRKYTSDIYKSRKRSYEV